MTGRDGIADQTPVGILRASHELRITYSNARLREMLGYAADELLQLTLLDVVALESVDEFRSRLDTLTMDEHSLAIDWQFIDVTRRSVWVRAHVKLIHDSDRRPNGFICVLNDIGDRVVAEAISTQERRLLLGIIDAIPQYIYVKDKAGRFVIANRAWRDVRGLTADALQGKTVHDVFPADIAQRLDTYDEAVLHGKAIIDLEHPLNDPALSGRWALTSKVPIRDENGTITALVGISRDITQQRRKDRERAMEHAATRVLSQSMSVHKTILQLLEDIAHTMGWGYAARWAWHAEGLQRTEWWPDQPSALLPQLTTSETPETLRERAFSRGKSVWAEDLAVASASKATRAHPGFCSAYAFPILADGIVIGVMEFFGRERWQPDDTFAETTLAIGNQIGQFIRRKSAEEALAEREEQFRAIFDNAEVGITLTDFDGRFIKMNGRYCTIVGYTSSELLDRTVFDLNLEENIPATNARRDALLNRSAATAVMEKQIVRKDGSLVWVAVATSVIHSADGTPRYFLAVVQDISVTKRAQLALEESEEQFRQLANNIPQVFWIADAQLRKLIYISPACEELYGVSPAEARKRGRRLIHAIHPDDRKSFYQERRKLLLGQKYTYTYRVFRHDGTVRWVEDRGFPILHADGTLHRVAGITADVTEKKRAEERLVTLAHYDGLTNLPNRLLLHQRLSSTLERASRRGERAAIMFLDLDRFKHVNDTFGHSTGDRVLREASVRISGAMRSEDTIARLGGDEFAIVLSNVNKVADAAAVAEKIVALFNDPFLVEAAPVFLTISIGIALYPAHGSDAETLIKNADVAMYGAKESGRNRYAFFHPDMGGSSSRSLIREAEFRNALTASEFVLHYQPQVELSSMKIVGFEALLRWTHPKQGLLTAGDFIESLESSDFIFSVGEWIIESVCKQIATWEQAGIHAVRVAINLSAKQFLSDRLEAVVDHSLTTHQINPQHIQIEITESSIVENTDEAIQIMRRLNAKGMQISIDDFGTGYSSLINLKRYPLNTVKIDRSFIRDITTDPDDAAIVKAVISMAHALSLVVVAEGVETKEQLEFLVAEGCDEVQGFYFSPAIPAAQCNGILQSQGCSLQTTDHRFTRVSGISG